MCASGPYHPRVHFLFQLTNVAWLNLIEPWWKTLRPLALKSRRFETQQHLTTALDDATASTSRPLAQSGLIVAIYRMEHLVGFKEL